MKFYCYILLLPIPIYKYLSIYTLLCVGYIHDLLWYAAVCIWARGLFLLARVNDNCKYFAQINSPCPVASGCGLCMPVPGSRQAVC